MQHTVYVKVWMSKSGYLKMRIEEDKPDDRYIGRLATHEHILQVYTPEILTPSGKISIIGRVARWFISEVME